MHNVYKHIRNLKYNSLISLCCLYYTAGLPRRIRQFLSGRFLFSFPVMIRAQSLSALHPSALWRTKTDASIDLSNLICKSSCLPVLCLPASEIIDTLSTAGRRLQMGSAFIFYLSPSWNNSSLQGTRASGTGSAKDYAVWRTLHQQVWVVNSVGTFTGAAEITQPAASVSMRGR